MRLNVMTDDAAEIAAVVKGKMQSSRVSHTVYVDRSGAVILDRTHDPRRSMLIPDSHLVGVYTGRAKQADIEDDLLARRQELVA